MVFITIELIASAKYANSFICSISVQPSILIVPDVQDVYTPLTSDIVVQLTEVGSFSNLCGLHVAKKAARSQLLIISL